MTRTHRTLALVGVAVGLLALGSCEPFQQIERDDGPPIAPGALWAWSPPDQDGLAPGDGDLRPTPEVRSALAAAIESTLAAQGFRLTSSDSAEFFVHFHLGQRDVTDTLPPPGRSSRRAAGGAWGSYGRPEEMADRTITWREGLLILDALRAADGSVAWRGILAGEVPPEVAAAPTPAVREAVRRLLAEFP